MDEWIIATILTVISVVVLLAFVIAMIITKRTGKLSKAVLCSLIIALAFSVIALCISASNGYTENEAFYKYYRYSAKTLEEELEDFSQNPYLNSIKEMKEEHLEEAREKEELYRKIYFNYKTVIGFCKIMTVNFWVVGIVLSIISHLKKEEKCIADGNVKRFCMYCGNPINNENEKFCSLCGKKI